MHVAVNLFQERKLFNKSRSFWDRAKTKSRMQATTTHISTINFITCSITKTKWLDITAIYAIKFQKCILYVIYVYVVCINSWFVNYFNEIYRVPKKLVMVLNHSILDMKLWFYFLRYLYFPKIYDRYWYYDLSYKVTCLH